MIPCINKQIWGVDCLGCGFQRALVLLFQGKFIEAFHMYPAIYPILTTVLFVIISKYIKTDFNKYIKVTLIILSILTIIISYLIKMKIIT